MECDKFSTTALDAHWAGFVQKLVDDAGPLVGHTFNSTLIDSYEVGGQDWSENFRAEFQKRRGYDPLTFLPTFTGRVVGSPEITERFLWDIAPCPSRDLFADNYYGHFQELLPQAPKPAARPSSLTPAPFESLQCGAPADVSHGRILERQPGRRVREARRIRCRHIYGKTIVGAESFTTADPEQGRWQNDPWSLKALGDLMYCTGLNRLHLPSLRHATVGPTVGPAALTMGQWGFHFERTVTR